MTSCGKTTYTDPDDYRANVPGAAVSLVLTSGNAFKTRVAWIKLRRLTLVTIEQAAPHIAFLSLDPSLVFASFPLRGEAAWNGVRLRRGDLALHGSGERLHQLAEDRLRWGLISIPAGDLGACAMILTGRDLALPQTPRLLRPGRKATA